MLRPPNSGRIGFDVDPMYGSTALDGANGAFVLPSPEPGWDLLLIMSNDGGWEHVSVSARRRGQTRTPTWNEMSFVKRTCWADDDVVMQLHPAESSYVNCHPNVLHLWRPLNGNIPTPPVDFV